MRLFLFISLLVGSVAWAEIPAFTKVDPSYSKVSKEDCTGASGSCEITNTPRITSQDGLGICYAEVAARMMQTENCRYLKTDCASLSEDELFSPIDLTRLVRPEDGSQPSSNKTSYKGLRLNSGLGGNDGGGDPHDTVMIAALMTQEVGSEACVSLDRVLSKMNNRGATVEAQMALWDRLKKYYNDYQNKKGCDSCLNNIYATAVEDINENMNLKASNQEILKAFGQNSYEKFLDDLLGASKCSTTGQLAYFENAKKIEYKMFPEPDPKDNTKLKEPITPDRFKEQVRKVLSSGRPVALGNICIGKEDAKNCNPKNNHGVVVAGYREVCKVNNPKDCRYAFKVLNSWGKSWQDQNDGGWVDADVLIQHTKIQPYVLGWFADKK